MQLENAVLTLETSVLFKPFGGETKTTEQTAVVSVTAQPPVGFWERLAARIWGTKYKVLATWIDQEDRRCTQEVLGLSRTPIKAKTPETALALGADAFLRYHGFGRWNCGHCAVLLQGHPRPVDASGTVVGPEYPQHELGLV